MTDLDPLFKAFADPTRRRILHLLARKPSLCVCHIIDVLAQPQPTVSRHLAYLKRSGVVADRKDGSWRHYSLVRNRDVARLLSCLDGRFDTDLRRLDKAAKCR